MSTAYSLRDYQSAALDGVRDLMRRGTRRVLLQAGTGSGKTVIAAHIMAGAQDKGSSVVFLAHRRELVYQCADKLRAMGVAPGIIMAGEEPLARHVQVASIQTLWKRVDRDDAEVPPCDLLVIDECHRSLAPTYLKLMDSYPDAFVLGLTATPARGDGRGLGDVYEAMICCPPVVELQDQGHLVPTRYFVPSLPDLEQVQIARGDYVLDQAARVMDSPKIVGDVIEHWARLARDRKTVVFATNVAHSKHLAERFREVGVAADHIDGKTPKDDRDAVLGELSDGGLQVVCNCDVLVEGWDQPDVSCVVIARPTKSLVRYLQMSGRCLRPWPGKVDAMIIDHGGVVQEHGLVEEFTDWALEESSTQANEKHRERAEGKNGDSLICCVKCCCTYTGGPACPHCGHVPQRRGRDIPVVEGDLQELDKVRKIRIKQAFEQDRERWWRELMGYAYEKGYKRGWIYHKFLEKFPEDPPPPKSWYRMESQQPGVDVQAWIKSRNIAFWKAKQRENAA